MHGADASPVVSASPSFDHYSATATQFSDIAARVVQEFGNCSYSDADSFHDDGASSTPKPKPLQRPLPRLVITQEEEEEEEETTADFEFAVPTTLPDSSPAISAAADIFYNGQIRPVFPLFNRDLLSSSSDNDAIRTEHPNPLELDPPAVELPLGRLLMDAREASAQKDPAAGPYCVWKPTDAAAHRRFRKSRSMESSSRRWRLCNLLFRSNSDGRENFVFSATASLVVSCSRKGARRSVTSVDNN